jgi:hypothetical protein
MREWHTARVAPDERAGDAPGLFQADQPLKAAGGLAETPITVQSGLDFAGFRVDPRAAARDNGARRTEPIAQSLSARQRSLVAFDADDEPIGDI